MAAAGGCPGGPSGGGEWCGERRPQRARRPLRQRRDGRALVARSTRWCWSASSGSPCCEAQRDLGIDVPTEAIEAYEAVIDQVDLESIEARERVTRHDVKARIEEFSRPRRPRAHPQGHDVARPHRERRAAPGPRGRLVLVRDRMVAALARLAERAAEHADAGDDRPQPQRAGPGHHARQALRQRRRGAAAGAPPRRRPARPLPAARPQGPGRHPAGPARPARRRRRSAWPRSRPRSPRHLGFEHTLDQRGPGVPAVARPRRGRRRWCRRVAGPRRLATTIRLMAGHELVTEGFQPGQVGSSAMPHKMNSRSCERINGFRVILARPPDDGRGPGRRPVERGRRVVLGGAPGRAARRLLRRRRRCSRRSSPCSTTSAPTPR